MRKNSEIKAKDVRLIGSSGEHMGLKPLAEALELSAKEGYDLVEIVAGSEPPVCKIMDYGKHLYKQSKKIHEAKKNQKVVHVKEIKMRYGIEAHDFAFKVKNAKSFLDAGNKIKVTVSFKGREISHTNLGKNILERIIAELEELGSPEFQPRMEGKNMVTIIAPKAT